MPSIAEAGYPAAEFNFWVGLSVPAKTPGRRRQAARCHRQGGVGSGVKERLARLGVEPVHMSVEEFGKFVKDDLAATVELAKAAHIEPTD